MTEHSTSHKIVVIGGGYAGTVAANHLRLRDDVDISLVNSRSSFVERIRLHQFAAGNYDASVDYGTILGDGIELVVDHATRVDTALRKVELASGRAIDYDYVIYAVGSTGAGPSCVPGAADFAYCVAELAVDQRDPIALVLIRGEAEPGARGGEGGWVAVDTDQMSGRGRRQDGRRVAGAAQGAVDVNLIILRG